MKIHKQWQGHIKADLETHYSTQEMEFETFISTFILMKDSIDLTFIVQ